MSPPSEERLAWLTGFTGSAGMAVVLTARGRGVFVDGRYTLQAAKQVDAKAWQVEPLADPPPESWLARHLVAGDRLGFDPWLHTSAAAERLAGRLRQGRRGAGRGRQQPARFGVARAPCPAARTGRGSRPAIFRRGGSRRSSSASALEIAQASASTRWCCRIRTRWPGPSTSAAPTSRIRRCRCPMRWCRRTAGRPYSSITASFPTARAIISNDTPMSRSPMRSTPKLNALAEAGASIALDGATAADALSRMIAAAGGKPVRGSDPVALLKAVKNATEIAGTRTAHRRDAVALARFLAWIDREAPSGAAHRDRHRRGAGDFPPRHRRAEGRLVPDHRRHRAERRDRALPRHPQDQPADRAGRSAADRFRRAV